MPASSGHTTPPDASALFAGAYDTFVRACGTRPPTEFDCRIARRGVKMRLANPELATVLTMPFEHLAAPPEDDSARADLTICVWTDIPPPAPDWAAVDYLGNTEIRPAGRGRWQFAFDSHLGMLSMYDADRQLALFWLRDARHVPITLAGTPFRIILQWWVEQLDGQLIHAAAIGLPEGGVAIAGDSGAGKTTTALLGVERGLRYAGDDFILIQPAPAPRVFSLYSSAKLDPGTLRDRFPALEAAVDPRHRLPQEKALLSVQRCWPGRPIAQFPLRALVLPTFVDRPQSCIRPTSPGDALRVLVPAIFPFPGQRETAVARLARLVRSVRSYRLELGRDSEHVAATLHTFVRAAAGEP